MLLTEELTYLPTFWIVTGKDKHNQCTSTQLTSNRRKLVIDRILPNLACTLFVMTNTITWIELCNHGIDLLKY